MIWVYLLMVDPSSPSRDEDLAMDDVEAVAMWEEMINVQVFPIGIYRNRISPKWKLIMYTEQWKQIMICLILFPTGIPCGVQPILGLR